jgi:hypothetical protein
MSYVSSFTESAAVLKISRYFRRQISYYRQHEIIIIKKTKKVFSELKAIEPDFNGNK